MCQECLNLAHSCLAAPSSLFPLYRWSKSMAGTTTSSCRWLPPAVWLPPAPEHFQPVKQGAGDLPRTAAGHRCHEGDLSSWSKSLRAAQRSSFSEAGGLAENFGRANQKSLSSRPRNNCDPCSRVLETLLNLQVAATRCERFLLLRPQQLIRSQSLPALAQSSSTCGKDHLDITILLLGSPRSLLKTKWPLVWKLTGTDWPSSRKTILLNNICYPCSRVLKNWLNIQTTATQFERFLPMPQQLVRSQSLPAAR